MTRTGWTFIGHQAGQAMAIARLATAADIQAVLGHERLTLSIRGDEWMEGQGGYGQEVMYLADVALLAPYTPAEV